MAGDIVCEDCRDIVYLKVVDVPDQHTQGIVFLHLKNHSTQCPEASKLSLVIEEGKPQ